MTQDNSQSMDKLLRGLSHDLHLGAVRNCCQEYADRARREGWTYERFLCELLQAENEQRAENAQKKRLKTAGFPQYKYMEELDMEELPEGARLLADELWDAEVCTGGKECRLLRQPRYGKDTPVHRARNTGMQGAYDCDVYLRAASHHTDKGMPIAADAACAGDQIQTLRPRHLRRIRVHGLRQGGRRTALQPPLAQSRDEVHHCYNKPLL